MRFAPSPVHTQQLATLKMAGTQVVQAIKRKDTQLLTVIADEHGISLGTDNAPLSVSEFRKQLRDKRGVYCDIIGCAGGSNSIRAELSRVTTTIRASLPSDFRKTGQVDVFEVESGDSIAVAQRSPLFTLFFIWRHGGWHLQQIEYI